MYPKIQFYDVTGQQSSVTQLPPLLMIKPPPTVQAEGIKLSSPAEGIILPSFCMLILGKPGAGKSHLISELLSQSDFFYQRFDRILYIGPTRYPGCVHDDYNTTTQFDICFIVKRIAQCNGWARNILIVMDDIVSQLPMNQKSRTQQLFFNRRHQLLGGTISIIITSQKMTSIPTWIRTTINSIFIFSIPKGQIKQLITETSLKYSKSILESAFSVLKKHEFIYGNLQTGVLYDSSFRNI